MLEGHFGRLEPLRTGHVPALAAAASRIVRTTSGYGCLAAMMRWAASVARALDDAAAGDALPFATIERVTLRVVGTTRFFRIEYWDWPPGNSHQRGSNTPDAAEIGHTWLAASAQRTGINTQAKLLMLTHAFENWRIHRASLRTDERNTRSQAAIERLGATRDGTLRAWGDPPAMAQSATPSSNSILDAEWPAPKLPFNRAFAVEKTGEPTHGRNTLSRPLCPSHIVASLWWSHQFIRR
jgi:RimJ/RimL family protein N-acetyltransferase